MLPRHSHTVPSLQQDHPEWHRGRKEYGLWLIELDSREVAKRVEAARHHLARYLLVPYERQPHITLFVCGFPAETPVLDDDFSRERLEVQSEELRRAGIGRFGVRIGGLNTFASAPYLEVMDPARGIDRIRTVLSAGGPELGRYEPYIPHVTVGLYSGVFNMQTVNADMAAFRTEPLELNIKKVIFATYRAEELAGALTGRREVVLEKINAERAQ